MPALVLTWHWLSQNIQDGVHVDLFIPSDLGLFMASGPAATKQQKVFSFDLNLLYKQYHFLFVP